MKQTTKFNISVLAIAALAVIMVTSVIGFDEADAKKKKSIKQSIKQSNHNSQSSSCSGNCNGSGNNANTQSNSNSGSNNAVIN